MSGYIDYSIPSSDKDRTCYNPDGTSYRYNPATERWSSVPKVEQDSNWDYRRVTHWVPSRGGYASYKTPGWRPEPFPLRIRPVVSNGDPLVGDWFWPVMGVLLVIGWILST